MAREHMKSLTHRQIADILGLLDQHCLKVDESHCRYAGEWTDGKLAETVSCHQEQVARLRRVNGFGRVTSAQPDKPAAPNLVALRALVHVVADLLERLGDEKRAAETRELLS